MHENSDMPFFLETCGAYMTMFDSKTASIIKIRGIKYPRLIFVDIGTGLFRIDENDIPFHSHSLICLKEEQTIKLKRSTGRTVIFLCFFSRGLPLLDQEVFEILTSNQEPILIPAHKIEQVRRNAYGFIDEQESKRPQYKANLTTGAIFMLLSAYRFRISGQTDDKYGDSHQRVKSVLDYVSKRYYEEFSLSKVAEMANISERQFTTICFQECGKTFIQFLNMVRVERAKELIANSDLSVTTVAFTVGFEDLSAFYRAFQKHFDKPPQHFRKSQAVQKA